MSVMDGGVDLEPKDVAARHQTGELQLVDVREDFEYEVGHVPGSLHVPMNGLVERVGDIATDRPVAFICLVGTRSAMAARFFRRQGFDAYNVSGGFARWFHERLPTEPNDAKVAHH